MKETNTQTNQGKKKIKKEDFIGFIFGINLAWSIGLGGIISYIIGTIFGVWLTKKMLSSKKSYVKVIFWILFVAIFVFGSIVHGMRSNSNYSSTISNIEDAPILETDKSTSTSQVSGNLYRNTKYNFRIKFPEGWEIQPGDGPNILQKAVKENNSINIGVREISAEYSNETATIKDAMSLAEFKDSMFDVVKEKFSGAKLLDYGETKLDNVPTYWIKYSAPYSALDINVEGTILQYQLFSKNIFYFITAGTLSSEFLSSESEFKKSIATFVIENF